jgi:hypothetical protein
LFRGDGSGGVVSADPGEGSNTESALHADPRDRGERRSNPSKNTNRKSDREREG